MIHRAFTAALAGSAALMIYSWAPAVAQNGNAIGGTAVISSTSGGDRIPAKTIVNIETVDAISSKTNIIGDTFQLKLTTPIIVDGRTVLPAGLLGRGEVTHAAKSGGGGRAGELIVNARYLECGDLRIPLGHFHYQVVGANNLGGAYAASIIPFGQFLVSGHDAIIPPGTSGTAQVNADVLVPAGALDRCANAGSKN